MSIPNTITAAISNKRSALLVLTTAAQALITNPISSGRSISINTLYVCNVSGAAATVDADIFRAGVAIRIAKGVNVPVAGTVAIVDRTDVLTLEEGDALRLTASANTALEATCAYETLS